MFFFGKELGGVGDFLPECIFGGANTGVALDVPVERLPIIVISQVHG